jgi:hypothetical protein
MTDAERAARLSALEQHWRERFVAQPKLPTSALLTGAAAMAMGFGAVLFFLSEKMRPYAWIWVALSVSLGLINRLLANRWYKKTVLPWSEERRALKEEIDALRER